MKFTFLHLFLAFSLVAFSAAATAAEPCKTCGSCPLGKTLRSSYSIIGEGHDYGNPSATAGYTAATDTAWEMFFDDSEYYRDSCVSTYGSSAVQFIGAPALTNGSWPSACIYFLGAYDCSEWVSADAWCCS